MRRTGRWIKRAIIGLVIAIVTPIIGVLFVLHTHWGRELVRKKVEAALQHSFPGGATIERLDGSVFGTLTVGNLDLNGRDGKRMLFVSSAKFHVELLPLLGGRVRVDGIELDDVVVDQHPQPPAPPEPPSPPSKPSAWTIELPSIEVRHAQVAVTTPRGVVELRDLELDASVSIVRGAISAAMTARGRAGSHEVGATVSARYAAGEVAVPFADVSLDRAEITALGAVVHLGDKLEGAGAVGGHVPAAVAQLFGVKLPVDASVVAVARNNGAIDASLRLGDATLRVMAQADLATKHANAFVVADVPDATQLDPRVEGGGIVTAALDVGADHVRGLVTADGVHPVDKAILGQDTVRATTLVAVDATLAKAWVLVDAAANVAGARSQVIADLTRATNGEVDITSSSVTATARKIAVEGSSVGWVAANVHASGKILPTPHLHVSGLLDANELRTGTLGVAVLRLRIDDLVRLPSIASSGHIDLNGITSGGKPFGTASLDLQGAVGTDGTIGIDLGAHTVTTVASGVWSGTGGHVAIEPSTITVRDVHTGNGNGQISASARYGRQSKDLNAKLDATDLALGAVQAGVRGMVGGSVTVTRRGYRWTADATLHGAQLALNDHSSEGHGPPVDVDVALHVAGREITGSVAAKGELGSATVAVDVEGPPDLTDAAAWRRLERKAALRDASIQLSHIDLSRIGASGIVDGKLDVTAVGATGTITERGFKTPRGQVDGDLAIAPRTNGPGFEATIHGQLVGIDGVDVVAELQLPVHLFDPVAWRTLGKSAFHGATIKLEPIAFDPKLISKLGVIVPYHGKLEATATIGEGAETATATLDVHGFQGGAIREPVELHVDAGVTNNGVDVSAATTTGATKLVMVTAHSPITVDGLSAVKLAPLDGTIEIPALAAKAVVALFGRADVDGGTIDGKITIGGTIGTPTAQVAIDAHDITIPASVSGKVPARLDDLAITGKWGGAAGELDITGTESGGGSLKISAHGRPDELAALTAELEAQKLDIAPFAAFAPGVVSAARGTVDAEFMLKGLDADTGNLHGTLDIHQARLPLSAVLGTFREGEVAVTVADHEVVARVDGKLGKGDVHGKLNATLVGSTPSKADLDLTLHQISLIQVHQPIIDASVTGKFTHGPTQWTGDLVIDNAHVTVPSTTGAKLLESSAPSDMIFVDAAVPSLTPLLQRPPPDRPWLIAGIDLRSTTVDVLQDEFQVRGAISGKVTLSVGQGSLGLDGAIDAERADIDLLGTRSQLDHGSVTFDGTLDPLLNVRVIRELTDFTVSADVGGRLSKPQIQLSSDSGSYTQGDLVSFFLGGEPSANQSETGQAAAAAGAGLASSLISKQINKVFPVKVDINYETATSTNSEAIRVGHWINRHLFIAGRTHIEARPDENANEAVGEYHFKGNTLIQANIGDRNYDGVDLIHRWHW